jgi:SAM-dependent methyltransferase
MASPEVSQVTAPLWERVIPEQSHNLISAIQNELDNYQVGNHLMDKPLRVLVLGCDAGYNAIRIASHFPETEVTAIDKSLRNITHAIYHANLLGLENISFKTDEADHLRRKGYYDVIDCSNYLNYEEDINACLHHLLAALSKGGLIKLGLNNAGEQEEITQLRAFVDNNDLSDHIDNVRALRHAIIDDAKTGLWQKTVTSPWFYNTFTVINTLFVEQKSYSVEDIKHICQLHDLDFIGYSQTRAGANKSQSSASALDKVSADQHDSIANQLEFYSQKANQNLGEVIFIKPAICL